MLICFSVSPRSFGSQDSDPHSGSSSSPVGIAGHLTRADSMGSTSSVLSETGGGTGLEGRAVAVGGGARSPLDPSEVVPVPPLASLRALRRILEDYLEVEGGTKNPV